MKMISIDDLEYAVEAEPDNGWISVKDRLPEYDKTVLVVNEDGYMHTAVRIKGSIARIDEWQIKFGVYFIDNDVWEEDEQGKITHWRLLPEPPRELIRRNGDALIKPLKIDKEGRLIADE